jgi:hypothetical protein
MARKTVGNWSIGAISVAGIVTLAFLWVFFTKPEFMVDGNSYVVTAGAFIPGILVGSAFWVIAEMFTPKGDGILDLVIRVVPAFIAGMIFGGILGLLSHFGRYLIVPMYYGNIGAIFDGITILVFALVTIWHAAWLHTRKYTR